MEGEREGWRVRERERREGERERRESERCVEVKGKYHHSPCILRLY